MTFDDMSHYNADSLCVRDKLNTSKLYCVLSLSKWPLNIQTFFRFEIDALFDRKKFLWLRTRK